MVNARGIARVSMLAVGLGIGAAVASMPGMASADSSDWLSSIDTLVSGLSLAAAGTSGLDMAISIDGVSLMQSGTAYAYSGSNRDIAMATGAGDTAYAGRRCRQRPLPDRPRVLVLRSFFRVGDHHRRGK
jgi:hypothetical protein